MTALLGQVEKLYGAELVNENKLGNSANVIFEIAVCNQPAILRISRYSEQKKRHVELELAWLQHLAQHVGSVAVPLASGNGNLYEVVGPEGDRWIFCVFHKAPVHIVDITNPLEWNELLFQGIGELMGRIHANTKPYVRENGMDEQLDWRHNYLFWPENNQWSDPDIQPIWDRTLEEMRALPKMQADYGIVHTDIHHQNFHVEEGKIVLFDFDDCEYSWYAYDIASTLFFVASTGDIDDAQSGKAVMESFGVPFLAGYRKHAELPAHWFEMMPLFLRYRRLAQYKYFFNLFHGRPNPHERYLNWAKQDILGGFTHLRYDFFSLVKQ